MVFASSSSPMCMCVVLEIEKRTVCVIAVQREMLKPEQSKERKNSVTQRHPKTDFFFRPTCVWLNVIISYFRWLVPDCQSWTCIRLSFSIFPTLNHWLHNTECRKRTKLCGCREIDEAFDTQYGLFPRLRSHEPLDFHFISPAARMCCGRNVKSAIRQQQQRRTLHLIAFNSSVLQTEEPFGNGLS